MSSGFRVKLEGKRAFASIKNLDRLTKAGTRSAFFESGKLLQQSARRLITDPPKTGRVYRINGKRHQASAPGEAPANLTGMLQRSIGYKTQGAARMEFGARAKYGGFLEDGTRKMKARPYLLPAIYKEQKNMLSIFERRIKQEIDG